MTAQPDPDFGRPPAAPTGFRKFAPFIASAATGGIVVMAGLYLMQTVFPQRLTPGYVAGTMAGSEQVGHITTSGDEQISYEVRSQAAQQALGVTTQAMQGAAAIANTADVLCGASRIAENLAAQESASRSALTSDAAWWKGFFGRVGSSTCGLGTEVRNVIIGEVTSNGRQSGTLSVRDVQQARPQQIIPVRTLSDAFAIQQPSRRYTQAEYYEAVAYVDKLDLATRDRLNDAYNGSEQSRDIYVERVRAVASLNNR